MAMEKVVHTSELLVVESREKLKEHIENRTAGGVYLTTIQKFEEVTGLLSNRADIICISDEAHRSQAGLGQNTTITEKGVEHHYGFAKYLRGYDEYRKTLDKQFKEETSNFKIAIVVAMWITGFDVSSLDAMYCFEPLQMHTLIQAISRVNRVYPGKTHKRKGGTPKSVILRKTTEKMERDGPGLKK